MRSGTLRHKIYLQEQTSTTDNMGGFDLTWNDVYSCRASIWTLNARERLDSMKLEVSAAYVFSLINVTTMQDTTIGAFGFYEGAAGM